MRLNFIVDVVKIILTNINLGFSKQRRDIILVHLTRALLFLFFFFKLNYFFFFKKSFFLNYFNFRFKYKILKRRQHLKFQFKKHQITLKFLILKQTLFFKKKLIFQKTKFLGNFLKKTNKHTSTFMLKLRILKTLRPKYFLKKYNKKPPKQLTPVKRIYQGLKKKQLLSNKDIYTFFTQKTFKRPKALNFFKKLASFNKKTLLLNLELSVTNLLLRSRFCFTKRQVTDFLKKKLVFINGQLCTSNMFILTAGDSLQLILTKNFVKYYFYFLSILLKWKFRLNYYFWRFNRIKHNLKFKKQRELPKWLFNLMYLNYKLPSYLEIDYSIFSFTLLKTSLKHNDFNKYNKSNTKTLNTRILNWYYLT